MWSDIDAPAKELEDWLHILLPFLEERASSWTTATVDEVADELQLYAAVIHGGMWDGLPPPVSIAEFHRPCVFPPPDALDNASL